MHRDGTVLGLQRTIRTTFSWTVSLPALRTRLLARKMTRVLFQQAGIDGPGHHPPCLMTEPFDFRKRRIARRSLLAKTPLRQHAHQLVELRLLSRRQIQIVISSVLAHLSLLSIDPIFPTPSSNLTRDSQIRHPSSLHPTIPPEPVPAP